MTKRRLHICAVLSILVAILAIALATAGPASACCGPGYTPPGGGHKVEVPSKSEGSTSNPTAPLGGESKSHPFPLDNYGLDEHVQFGITHLGNTFNAVTEWVIQMIWFGLIYVFNGIMMMLQWAFSLDLLQGSMSKLTEALGVMREHIDTPWGLAAVAAMALWGIWNGLVRKKSIDTLRGLLISVLCMAALLVVIGNPVETLGQFTSAANGASTEMLDSITSGSVQEPQQAVGSTEESLFNTVILRPWCALQFGDVEYCLSKPQGLNQSVADTWLQAQPDSSWRTSLWNITKSNNASDAKNEEYGEDPPGSDRNLGDMYNLAGHPERVEMISGRGSSSIARLGLLVLIVVGLVGAICLFTYLAARLLMAALFVLVLAMFAPAMFLVAALGEAGRQSVYAWFLRLLGAIATKVVFALFLAVIVAASNLVTVLKLGFFPTWIVFIAFWWGVLLKRKDLLALLSLDAKTASPSGIDFNGASGGNGLSELFYAKQLMGDVRRGARRVRRGATAAPFAVGRRGKDAAKRAMEARRLGQSDAARQFAREQLVNEGRAVLERRNAQQHRAELARSADVFANDGQLRSKLAKIDSQIAQKRRSGRQDKEALAGLQGERAEVKQDLRALHHSSAYARAKSAVGSKPREVTQGDIQAWMTDRRAELAHGAGAPQNLRAAGIDPEAFKRSSEAQKNRDRAKSGELLERHKGLFDRAGIGQNGEKNEAMGFQERRLIRAEMRATGRIGRFEEVSRDRAFRHRQTLRNERRNERRRRRNVR